VSGIWFPQQSGAGMNMPRPIVITPYFKEDPALLKRCIASVRNQTTPTEHLLVADGYPQEWIDAESVRHLRLDRSHGDYGNTPRGIGALLATSESYPAIVFLDADNWLEPEHIQLCLHVAASSPGTDFVITRRNFRRPDGSIMPIQEEPSARFVDTNCYAFFPGSYHVLPVWAMMPQKLSPVGDRVFWVSLNGRGLSGVAITDRATVNYQCLWETFYRALGEQPPAGGVPVIDATSIFQWWSGLDPRQQEIVWRLTAAPMNDVVASVSASTARVVPPQ
jgi:glycosyltransferase involved in cell wall biosynthesis